LAILAGISGVNKIVTIHFAIQTTILINQSRFDSATNLQKILFPAF
jgi:hypothetical protein